MKPWQFGSRIETKLKQAALPAVGLDVFFSVCFVWGGNDGDGLFNGVDDGWWWVFGVDDVQLVVGNMGGLGRLVVLGFLGYPLWKGIVA